MEREHLIADCEYEREAGAGLLADPVQRVRLVAVCQPPECSFTGSVWVEDAFTGRRGHLALDAFCRNWHPAGVGL